MLYVCIGNASVSLNVWHSPSFSHNFIRSWITRHTCALCVPVEYDQTQRAGLNFASIVLYTRAKSNLNKITFRYITITTRRSCQDKRKRGGGVKTQMQSRTRSGRTVWGNVFILASRKSLQSKDTKLLLGIHVEEMSKCCTILQYYNYVFLLLPVSCSVCYLYFALSQSQTSHNNTNIQSILPADMEFSLKTDWHGVDPPTYPSWGNSANTLFFLWALYVTPNNSNVFCWTRNAKSEVFSPWWRIRDGGWSSKWNFNRKYINVIIHGVILHADVERVTLFKTNSLWALSAKLCRR